MLMQVMEAITEKKETFGETAKTEADRFRIVLKKKEDTDQQKSE